MGLVIRVSLSALLPCERKEDERGCRDVGFAFLLLHMRWLWTRRVLTASLALGRRSTHSATAIALRPYQEHCLQACTDALSVGSTRIGVSLPTGAGKTTVFISLLSRIPTPALAPEATRSLIIVNSVELARQTAEQTRRLFPDWSVEIEQGKHQASGTADVYACQFRLPRRTSVLVLTTRTDIYGVQFPKDPIGIKLTGKLSSPKLILDVNAVLLNTSGPPVLCRDLIHNFL